MMSKEGVYFVVKMTPHTHHEMAADGRTLSPEVSGRAKGNFKA
jgi:hypothetical protein